jgi:hypothetical protein
MYIKVSLQRITDQLDTNLDLTRMIVPIFFLLYHIQQRTTPQLLYDWLGQMVTKKLLRL